MILGFLGKGGSGKTTLATLMVKYLAEKGNTVLAIDNDHNMDLAFNLGQENGMPYVGQSIQEAYDAVGIAYTLDILEKPDTSVFSLSPIDPFTHKYSKELSSNVRLMVSGPHTEKIMSGAQCSHALTMPLKVYLPFLSVKSGEYVVVDEKAGADGVGTGITTGFNAALVVVEATRHGLKAGLQIATMLEFYKTPYAFVLNKVRNNEILEEIEAALPKAPLAKFFVDESAMDLNLSPQLSNELQAIQTWLLSVQDSRRERVVARLHMLKSEVEK